MPGVVKFIPAGSTWNMKREKSRRASPEKAPRKLGATRWQARQQVALPMLLSRGRPMILLTFLFNLGSYEIPLLLGRQSPQMFSVLTQRRFGQFDLMQRPEAFVLAITYFLLVGLGLRLLLSWRKPHV